jgi:hypothetical protein
MCRLVVPHARRIVIANWPSGRKDQRAGVRGMFCEDGLKGSGETTPGWLIRSCDQQDAFFSLIAESPTLSNHSQTLGIW